MAARVLGIWIGLCHCFEIWGIGIFGSQAKRTALSSLWLSGLRQSLNRMTDAGIRTVLAPAETTSKTENG